jgi:hypothetical protein
MMKTRLEVTSTLLLRHGWFVLAFAVWGAKDSCAGGGKRPDPPPAPSAVAAPPPTGAAAAPTENKFATPPAAKP